MSDRGRSRRTARSTKATSPQAPATPASEVQPGEQPADHTEPTPATPRTTPAARSASTRSSRAASGRAARAATGSTDGAASADDAFAADSSKISDKLDADSSEISDRLAADASEISDKSDRVDVTDAEADEVGWADVDAGHADVADVDEDAADADEDAADADEDAADEDDTKAKGKSAKSKAPAQLTKAEKRAAARIAAAKAARRRRVGQAIAGTLVVLLAVGGAFVAIWYFGNRAEENKIHCKPVAGDAFPPLLGGMDKKLKDEPKLDAGTGDVTKVKATLLVEGDCKAVKAGQTVTVNYIGATFKDGKVFDSSWPHKKTLDIPVGMKQKGSQPQVIEGWDEGLVGLKVGTRVQLDIPGSKAYGDTAPAGYPSGALRFIVDILDAKDTPDSGGLPAGLGG